MRVSQKLASKMKDDGWLLISEAAELVGIGIPTMYRWCQAGNVKTVTVGACRYIEVKSLVTFLGPDASKALGIGGVS
jgi:predicted site-specific integrase-resolvase